MYLHLLFKAEQSHRKGGIIMPGFNGTGPMGYGSRTGRGLGICAQNQPDYNAGGCRVYGRGRGGAARGCGRGWGRRRGRSEEPSQGFQCNTQDRRSSRSLSRPALEDERAYLEDRKQILERHLAEISMRLDEIARKQAEDLSKES